MKIFLIIFITLFLFNGTAFATGESAEIIYAKAYANIYKNNTKNALVLFEKGIKNYPDCTFLYAGMGDLYLKEGNYSKAMDFYTIAQRKSNAHDIYKIDFYNAALKKNMQEINQALNDLIILTKNYDNPVLYKNIKFIMHEKYSSTILLTDIYSNITDEKLTQANSCRQNGDKETALKMYLRLFSENNKNFQAANNAGVIFWELKDYNLAEKYLKHALEINPNSALISNNLAVLSLYKKNYADMQKYFEESKKINPSYFPVLNNIVVAKIHQNLNFYQTKNVDSILDIIKKDNENIYAVRTLAKIYFLKEDYRSADILLRELSSHYNFKLFTQKAYTAYKNNDFEKALTYINTAISLYSDNSADYVIRGRIYTASKQYVNAINDFNKALQKNKNEISAYYYKGLALQKNGNIDDARTSVKQFLNSKKGNSQSSYIKLLLD